MSNSQNQNAVSPEQLAANRANAAKSTGPRSAEGKARSSQNARKHGFAAANYTAVGLEDVEEVAALREDAIEFYQPVNSQELFLVERIALTQQAILRAARLEAALFSGLLPAEGFELSAAKSTALALCIRYSAHAERQYRRAVDEFEHLKSQRPGADADSEAAVGARGETKPSRGKLTEEAMLAYLNAPMPPLPTWEEYRRSDLFRTLSGPPSTPAPPRP